jgi:hypothetical protein
MSIINEYIFIDKSIIVYKYLYQFQVVLIFLLMEDQSGISQSTIDRATALKYRLSHFYTTLLEESIEREKRMIECDSKLASEPWSEDKKKRQFLNLRQKESAFLRLRRVRLGIEDFLTIQVIGKGAYGEVSLLLTRFDWFKNKIMERFMP